jgi:hypothetical protein
MGAERAGSTESTKRIERAIRHESATLDERASANESTEVVE